MTSENQKGMGVQDTQECAQRKLHASRKPSTMDNKCMALKMNTYQYGI